MICAVSGLLGPSGALLAALLQNFSILIVIVNAGRILKFQEILS
jgi:Cd2+/Zn2+-exporting ATPase